MAAKKKVVEEDEFEIRSLKAPKVKEDGRSKFEKIQALAEQCNEALGVEGKVYLGKDHEVFERIPTGNLALDAVIGGGLVRRHLMELYGEESSGKTTAALQCVANVQRLAKRGKTSGIAVWLEGEEFDEEWAERQGVNVDKLFRISALTGDGALETAATFLEEGDPDLMVFDSYQALGTRREMESGVDKEAYAGGGSAQLWGRFYRRTRGAFNGRRAATALVGISQVRDPIGVFSPNGKPEPRPTQIRVLKHWKSIAVMCKKGEPRYLDGSTQKKRIEAREFHFKCPKNKTASPEKVSSYWYQFRGDNPGIDKVDLAIRLGKVYDLLEQKGAWTDGYGLHVQGEKRLRAALEADPKLVRTIFRDISNAILLEK